MGDADDDGDWPLPQLCFQCGGAVPWGDSHGEGGQRLGGDCPASHRVFRETTLAVTPISPMRRQSDSARWRSSSGVWASMESIGIS